MLNGTAHGRLGRDTELRYQSDGTAVADMAIGCNIGRKGQDGKRPTQWLKATLWGKMAEGLAPHLTKGNGVVVIVSDVQVRTYNKQDGSLGVSLEARADHVEFTGAGPRDDAMPAPAKAPAQRPAPVKSGTGFDDMDDDIPF